MARHLSPEEIAVFKHEFDQYDTDGGGSISVEEFGRVMSASGQKPSDEELAQIIKEVDLDGDGTISFNEFITMMTGHPYPPPAATAVVPEPTPAATTVPESLQPGHAPVPEKEVELDSEADLRAAWKEFDPSCNSSITTAQFRQAVSSLGETVSDKEIEEIMDDVDGEEKITFKEFTQFMKRKDGAVDDIVDGYGS